jgi:ubiquinone/menaquinone biosynthesis C-methylase UbiE
MTALAHSFDDGEAYERFMGGWSRAVAVPFLQWLAAPPARRWLDVGCGSGVFTQMVLNHSAASSVVAIDPSAAQVGFARKRVDERQAEFQVAAAEALPFASGSFDIVCSALVLNFVTDPDRALSEMRRVARPGGLIAAYVWDFEPELSPSRPLRTAMRQTGLAVPQMPGSAGSSVRALTTLFAAAGLEGVASRQIDATVVFRDFDEYWRSQTPSYSPITKIISSLASHHRSALIDALKKALPAAKDGSIRYAARANAVKARSPV